MPPTHPTALPLAGRHVLVPRGGSLGARLSDAVSARGGQVTVAPLIAFAEPGDSGPLIAALARLRAGEFDWLAVTSATTVDVLGAHAATVADRTRIAAVGPATREALHDHGLRVDFIPGTFTAATMVAEWPTRSGRVLLPQSAIAPRTLAEGLSARGLSVEVVTAYETRPLRLDDVAASQLRAGGFDAVLATSGSMARAIAEHCSPLPDATALACIGQSTATAAAEVGLRADVVADSSGAEALVEALSRFLAADTPATQPSLHPSIAPAARPSRTPR